ncbi:MAG: hypothetical protein LLF75_10165 [Eubacteriales bacterium]|nr:hypothetical protein [Eubacteriales bacterium]
MVTNPLQKRISSGDRDAFKAVYSEYGRGVFLAALKALGSEAAARDVVKQTFLNLHRELFNAADDMDIPVRIRELTDHEILVSKIVQNKDSLSAFSREGAANGDDAGTDRSAERYSEHGTFSGFASEDADDALPPLERTQLYMEADRTLSGKKSGEPASVQKQKRRGSGFVRFLLILLLLLLLWALAGVLMDIHLIPSYDLGYRWFNTTIYPLFSLFA